jgi:cation diffusion facilitator family transporter
MADPINHNRHSENDHPHDHLDGGEHHHEHGDGQHSHGVHPVADGHDHPHPHPDGHDHEHPHPHDHVHEEGHDHPHPHDHDPDHDHSPGPGGHRHDHGSGVISSIRTIFHWHGHDHSPTELASDQAFLHNEEGIRTVWLALGALLFTSVLQVVIVLLSGSVALLADTIHNIGDMLNSVPLLIAFYLARRIATRRYTYGFGKAEDVAGVIIVLSIAFSAAVVFWESFKKLIDPEPMTNLGWVAAAAIIGFIGNEAVAILQIRTGRKIGSAALVTDGLHARTDGLTSLSVLLAAGGTWIGLPILDPIIGILIGIAILFITRDAIVAIWYRLMDAIEPEYMDQAEAVVARQDAVEELCRLRMRWVGHRLHAELVVAVDPELTTVKAHNVAEDIRHDLFHEIPTLSDILVHVEPWGDHPDLYHERTRHHEPVPRPLSK